MTIVFESLGGDPTDSTGSLSIRFRPRPTLHSEALEPGNGRLHIEALFGFTSDGGEDTPPPTFGALSIVVRAGMIGFGNTTDLGSLRIVVPVAPRFYASASHLSIVQRPGARLTEAPPPPLPPAYDIELMPDTMLLGDVTAQQETAVMRAALELGLTLRSRFEGTRQLRDGITFEAQLAVIVRELLRVSALFGSAVTVTKTAIEHMIDALLLGDVVSTELEAHELIVSALAFGSLSDLFARTQIADTVSFNATVADVLTAMQEMVDGLLIGAADEGTVTFVTVMQDALAVGADVTTDLEALTRMRDRVNFIMRLSVDNGEYIAYALNVESKGLSRYTNYPFNSFMKVGGKYYGAADTGLFLLEGDDDDGEAIKARIRLGLSTMGSFNEKRWAAAYLYYKSNGDLLLQVVKASDVDGEREAYFYRLRARAAKNTREGRVPIGQGLKSVYYDFVLENVDGADFALDVLKVEPLVLERRVTGKSGGKR